MWNHISDDSYEMPLKVVGDQVLVKIGNNWYDLDPSKSEHETHTEPTGTEISLIFKKYHFFSLIIQTPIRIKLYADQNRGT